MKININVFTAIMLMSLLGCAPKVKLEAPDKPIRIDMNVKIDHEVRVKVEKDVENVLSKEKGLF